MQETGEEKAALLMDRFAAATGLDGPAPPRRYLWTDAFAVCNLLGLWRAGRGERYLRLARKLVDQVHHVLGRHRNDDPRSGWISGLAEEEGEAHPTAGGLRIGKPLPEARPGEPVDSQGEWDRDGQYYHYLTRWMHALHRVARETGEGAFFCQSVELARAAQAGFVEVDDAGRPASMAWKMSTDLTRALVPSMGQHDPLDGWITLASLQAFPVPGEARADLSAEMAQLRALCEGISLASSDPLSAGSLLVDVHRLALLAAVGSDPEGLLDAVLDAALASACAVHGDFSLPARFRLAFRELGLCIGLAAVETVPSVLEKSARAALLSTRVEELRRHLPLRERIERFWLDPAHRRAESWTDHEDINAVMLATSLAPEGYLGAANARGG